MEFIPKAPSFLRVTFRLSQCTCMLLVIVLAGDHCRKFLFLQLRYLASDVPTS